MPELPTVLGSEVAGELDGNRVMGFVRTEGGGYAERVVVDRRWLLPLPAGASFAEGAAFPMAFLTAWIPLTQLLKVAFGARVLVTAAAGAVGTAAIQLVKVLNGRPVAAVGSEEKLELTRSLGAVEAVTYEGIGELEPVDAVFDLVGGDVFAASLSLAQADGHGRRGGLRGRALAGPEPDVARRPQHRRARLLPRPPDRAKPGARRAGGPRCAAALGRGTRPAGRRCRVPTGSRRARRTA